MSFPSEHKLAEQFGVNRSTVREGIRLLEENGVLKRDFGKRLTVRRPTYGDVGERIGQVMMLHGITFREVMETTTAIEIASAGTAARRRTDEDISKIDATLARTREALGNPDELAALDIEFHDLIVGATRNRALALTIEPLLQLLYPTYRVIYASEKHIGEKMLSAHSAIAQAIALSDAETARRWMEHHLADFRRAYELAGIDINQPVQPPQKPASKAATPDTAA